MWICTNLPTLTASLSHIGGAWYCFALPGVILHLPPRSRRLVRLRSVHPGQNAHLPGRSCRVETFWRGRHVCTPFLQDCEKTAKTVFGGCKYRFGGPHIRLMGTGPDFSAPEGRKFKDRGTTPFYGLGL